MSRASAPTRRIAAVLALAGTVGLGTDVGLGLAGFDPDPVRVLLVALAIGAVVALLGATEGSAPTWDHRTDLPAAAGGQDSRTSAHLRVVEGNRTAAAPDPALRERLRSLTELTLGVRHGTSLDDPTARARLGPRLAAVLDGPPRRLSAAELDACLDEIEGL